MEFDSTIHTKEFLLNNVSVAFELARKSDDFVKSDLAFDMDIICLKDKLETPLAHMLAIIHAQWMTELTANSIDILSITDGVGETVAHKFAHLRPAWVKENASNSPAVLMMANKWGLTVAHTLARYQSEWVNSAALKVIDILKIADRKNWSVAHELARSQPNWLLQDEFTIKEILTLKSHPYLGDEGSTVAEIAIFNNKNSFDIPCLMHKQILTIPCKDGMLADVFIKKHADIDVSIMVFKLIEQGAAYKSVKPIPLKAGESLLKQCKLLIEDNTESLITLKQLQALYSTFAMNVENIKKQTAVKTLDKWELLLQKSESLIRQHLESNPSLYNIEHTVDIFCEHADELVKRMQSERLMRSNLTSLDYFDTLNDTELTTVVKGIY